MKHEDLTVGVLSQKIDECFEIIKPSGGTQPQNPVVSDLPNRVKEMINEYLRPGPYAILFENDSNLTSYIDIANYRSGKAGMQELD